ncbi:hypothetical protein NLC29_00405 [Candidatus Aminicenantes bacterium AH-873-B07]|jgi:hypothetical protein|nr:hypothetical protein [Candidatus Aminicenantes bacterium AH-873-B07]
MKKITQFKKRKNKFESLGVKFMSGNCICDIEACYSKCEDACQGQNMDIGFSNMSSKSADVGSAINAVPMD